MSEPLQSPVGTSHGAGQRLDSTAGRTFPCDGCGADLEFSIGAQSLACPYCGHRPELAPDPQAVVEEQDLAARLTQLAERRQDAAADAESPGTQEIACGACGATVVFTDSLTSTECSFCGSPLQRDSVHRAADRIPVDGVLPFRVPADQARQRLHQWVKSRWFAPSEFVERGVEGRFSGVYLPYWTFDAMTSCRYQGERGDHYHVTVGSGKNQRRERQTRWSPASGEFQQFFDDVLVVASRGLPTGLLDALEPWPLGELSPFSPTLLAGFEARTYDASLEEGLGEAKQRMEAELHDESCRRIGGDEQRIHQLLAHYAAMTYKHLLLPVWMLTYRYGDKPYRVTVNATTGELVGERPWSAVKITVFVLSLLLFVVILVALFGE